MLLVRRRRVRVHQLPPAPTIEGLLVSSWNSHYRLLRPEVLEAKDRSVELAGEAWIPREKVVFLETV